jgi:hypothetical protein
MFLGRPECSFPPNTVLNSVEERETYSSVSAYTLDVIFVVHFDFH